MELRVEIVVAEESCQFGAVYKKKNGTVILSYYILVQGNILCGLVVC